MTNKKSIIGKELRFLSTKIEQKSQKNNLKSVNLEKKNKLIVGRDSQFR